MPDPLEYCNAEIQYAMELGRRLHSAELPMHHDPSCDDTVSMDRIDQEIRNINRKHPAMLSETGRKNVRHLVFDFLNKGIKFGGRFYPVESNL